MLRERINEALHAAMRDRNETAAATLRLIMATVKDREFANRAKGMVDDLDEGQIMAVLQSMIEQRNESIQAHQRDGQDDLARREAQEIEVIKGFLPKPMSDEELDRAIDSVIEELGARSLKDMGRIMATLKARYAGRMDVAKAHAMARDRVSGAPPVNCPA